MKNRELLTYVNAKVTELKTDIIYLDEKLKTSIQALEDRFAEWIDIHEQPLIKKNAQNLNSDDAKLSDVKQPDWENLLSVDDVVEHAKGWTNNTFYTKKLNKLIHERIKPLLEDNNNLKTEVVLSKHKLEISNKIIEKLNDTFNYRLLNNIGDTMKELEKTKAELSEANKRIAQLEALNEAYELSILNRTQPDQIDVPFFLDRADDVWFGDKKNALVYFWNYCKQNNIDQTRIKRILLEMKSEDEEWKK